MPGLDSCISFPVDGSILVEMVQKARDWALVHGITLRTKASLSEDSLQVFWWRTKNILGKNSFILQKLNMF